LKKILDILLLGYGILVLDALKQMSWSGGVKTENKLWMIVLWDAAPCSMVCNFFWTSPSTRTIQATSFLGENIFYLSVEWS
jgi:hypothetical protein